MVLNAKNGTVVSVNDRVLETTDLPLPDLVGKRLEEVWHLQSQIVDQLMDSARVGQFLEQVASIVDSGGRQRWLRLNSCRTGARRRQGTRRDPAHRV